MKLHPKEIQQLSFKRLDTILNEFCNKRVITLLNIDVEGNEMEVIESMNSNIYNPLIICVEIHNFENSYIKRG